MKENTNAVAGAGFENDGVSFSVLQIILQKLFYIIIWKLVFLWVKIQEMG